MSTPDVLPTLLLLALPASGKSEARRFLLQRAREFGTDAYHIGDTIQLDDFPYVHFMRVIDEGLEALGQPRRFYPNVDEGFLDGRDWGTLLRLVNDDHVVVTDSSLPTPVISALPLFERIDRARQQVGAPTVFEDMDPALKNALADRLQGEAERLVTEQFSERPQSLAGRTLVIEFARGGPEGATMPLAPPHGYRYALAQLRPEILEQAAILYIWVTPEESRRKNLARADPDDPGSILHHSAPESVMRNDYGCCDMDWLIQQSEVPNTLQIEAHGRTFTIPVARLDNRVDLTTFVRDDIETWDPKAVAALDAGVTDAMGRLWSAWTALHA